jgi:DNA replication regulator SLD3
MSDLVAFLESLVLPTALVDKKYKDAIPEVVSTLVSGDVSADELEKARSKSTRQKIKKMKPGKNGLYPAEDSYIRQWWGHDDDNAEISVPDELREVVVKKRIAKLRIRETQLQMIVILETLALQPLAGAQTDNPDELPLNDQKDCTSSVNVPRGRSKKPLDLAVLIEVLVDRLCIWQSVADEEGIAASSMEKGSKISMRSADPSKTHGHAADTLRDFCTEVIVPL